jgi:alanine dehydrogenase
LIVKVKQPAPQEYKLLDNFYGKILFSMFHLAGRPISFIERLLENKITAMDYMTVKDEKGGYPILKTLREICGTLAIEYGTQFLQKKYGSRGITISSIENTKDSEVVIIGGGVAGSKATTIAAALGAKVTLLEIKEKRIKELKKELREFLGPSLFHNITFLKSTEENLEKVVKKADLLIGAASIHGERAPVIVKEHMVKEMKKGSVIVDVVISQGGCIWGSKITTSFDPIYNYNGILYCCIENLPGEVSLQGTQALTKTTLPYLIKLADKGIDALREDKNFAHGVHTYKGKITYKPVAEYFNLMDNYISFEEID